MEQSTVFKSNRSQAVRLPKAVALPDDVKRVDVVAVGRTALFPLPVKCGTAGSMVKVSVMISWQSVDNQPNSSANRSDAQVHA